MKTTLKGLYQGWNKNDATPLGLKIFWDAHPG